MADDRPLTQVFHERTQRCVDPSHIDCREIEMAHQRGEHASCLPAECGHTNLLGHAPGRAYAFADGTQPADETHWVEVRTFDGMTHRRVGAWADRVLAAIRDEDERVQQAIERVQQDARVFGTGWLRFDHHDGEITARPVDPSQVVLMTDREVSAVEASGIRVEYGHVCTPDEQDCCRRCTTCHKGHLPEQEPEREVRVAGEMQSGWDGAGAFYARVEGVTLLCFADGTLRWKP